VIGDSEGLAVGIPVGLSEGKTVEGFTVISPLNMSADTPPTKYKTNTKPKCDAIIAYVYIKAVL